MLSNFVVPGITLSYPATYKKSVKSTEVHHVHNPCTRK
nr:MAG TPA: hypothetical protein [Caudoviricetes sp.]